MRRVAAGIPLPLPLPLPKCSRDEMVGLRAEPPRRSRRQQLGPKNRLGLTGPPLIARRLSRRGAVSTPGPRRGGRPGADARLVDQDRGAANARSEPTSSAQTRAPASCAAVAQTSSSIARTRAPSTWTSRPWRRPRRPSRWTRRKRTKRFASAPSRPRSTRGRRLTRPIGLSPQERGSRPRGSDRDHLAGFAEHGLETDCAPPNCFSETLKRQH